jgi:hypothetical protein
MKKLFKGLGKVFEWIGNALNFLVGLVFKLALIVAVIGIAIPAVYIWDQWDKPMTLPQAQEAVPGLTMKELVEDRLEGWEAKEFPGDPERGKEMANTNVIFFLSTSPIRVITFTIGGLNPEGKLYSLVSKKDIEAGFAPSGYSVWDCPEILWYNIQRDVWSLWVESCPLGNKNIECGLPLPVHHESTQQ